MRTMIAGAEGGWVVFETNEVVALKPCFRLKRVPMDLGLALQVTGDAYEEIGTDVLLTSGHTVSVKGGVVELSTWIWGAPYHYPPAEKDPS